MNSSAIGAYADYLTREIIPFVDREFRTLASREHRGCFGKSSGGYGAIIHGMKYAKHWGAIADHSGDAYFDFVYHHDWPNTLNELAKYREPKRVEGAYDVLAETRTRKGLAEGCDDGRVKRFLEAVWKKEKLSHAEGHAIMNVCMAATYDPDPEGAAGVPPAVQSRDRREARRAVAGLAEARPDPAGRQARGEPAHAQGDLHRLRLARPVSHPLRHAAALAAAGRGRHPARVRGIRRQSLGRRLPDGRQPAVSLPGAEAVARVRPGSIATCAGAIFAGATTSRTGPARIPAADLRAAAACRLGGGALVVIVIASLIFGVNPLEMIGALESGGPTAPPGARPPAAPGYGPQNAPAPGQPRAPNAPPDPAKDFVAAVLGDTEDVWKARVPGDGRALRAAAARAVPARHAVGLRPRVGGDRAVLLLRRPRALPRHRVLRRAVATVRRPGRFRAGLRDRARGRPPRAEPDRHDGARSIGRCSELDARGRNALSVRLELQADCYAGVWGYFAQRRNKLEVGDLEEGFRAAAAVGDDEIQKRAQGYVVPESFTHGTADQRLRGSGPGSNRATCAAATPSADADLGARPSPWPHRSSPLPAAAPNDAVADQAPRASPACCARGSTTTTPCSASARARPSGTSRPATGSPSSTWRATASTSTTAASRRPPRASSASTASAGSTATAARRCGNR